MIPAYPSLTYHSRKEITTGTTPSPYGPELNRKVCRSSPDFQQESWDVLSEGNATFKSSISPVLGTFNRKSKLKNKFHTPLECFFKQFN